MALNWREIDLILNEISLEGSFVQEARQPDYKSLYLQIFRPVERERFYLAVILDQPQYRFHKAIRRPPKAKKPPRFYEFLRSRVVGGKIEECTQLGMERIVRFTVLRGGEETRLYLRLWANNLNLVATDADGTILDAFFRRPKKGEVTGGRYTPETDLDFDRPATEKDLAFTVRELPGDGPFQERLRRFYEQNSRAASNKRNYQVALAHLEGELGRAHAHLSRLLEEEKSLGSPDRLKEYGDLVTAVIHRLSRGDTVLETVDSDGNPITIPLDSTSSPADNAQGYYTRYKKALSGARSLQAEIHDAAKRIEALESRIEELSDLDEDSLARTAGEAEADRKRAKRPDDQLPGRRFSSGEFLLIVGRTAKENDSLLRKHVRGNDWWVHTRDYPGSYVFIRPKSSSKEQSVPLEVLLDAGNLAIYFSKARTAGKADLYYTAVKHLRRPKNYKAGLVLPTQEKNLFVETDESRIRRLFSEGKDSQ